MASKRVSIRRFLLLAVLAVAGTSMLVTGLFSYREAASEVEEIFDAQLAQSARMLVATLTTQPLWLSRTSDDTVVFPVWQPNGHSLPAYNGDGNSVRDEDDDSVPDVANVGHKYETRLVFQLWEGNGERLLMRSANAPLQPIAPFASGYADANIGNEKFHVFCLPHDGLWLQVAQDDYMRRELSREIAFANLKPYAVGLPLMGLLIWLALARGLRPIDALREAIAGRDAGNLSPVDADPSSVELQPMVDELNGLLARLTDSFERERRFTSDAAHELRTPLAVLRIHAENAMTAIDDESQRHALTMLLRGVDRAARLVEQLLTIARVEPEVATRTFAPIRFGALVREELAMLVPVAEKRTQEIDFGDNCDCSVNGDRALLGILVRNLVDNALRYSPDGSLVQVMLTCNDGTATLRVEDEGPGIPPELAERVFERFFRGDQAGTGVGAGLGLAIVRRIVDLHHGQVVAVSRRGEHAGALVVTLPVVALPSHRI